jgi:hypothetical protein
MIFTQKKNKQTTSHPNTQELLDHTSMYFVQILIESHKVLN